MVNVCLIPVVFVSTWLPASQNSGKVVVKSGMRGVASSVKAFDITYVRLKFYTSRPESFVIYKRMSEDGEWIPYQYYSATCQFTYNVKNTNYISYNNETQALCTSEFSDISPLTGGNVAFSTLEGRPSAYNFENSPQLQAFQKFLNVINSNSENGMKDTFDASESEENEGYPSPKRISPSPCTACLGILQDTCDEMLSKVQLTISESGHVFDDFVLQLSFPVAVDLRDRLLFLHLKEKLQNSYSVNEAEMPSVKDVWKWVIGSQLGKTTNSDFTPYSDFQIILSVVYPDSAKECYPLFKKCPDAFPNRRKKRATPEEIYTRAAVTNAMDLVSSEIKNSTSLLFTNMEASTFNIFEFPPAVPDNSCTYKIQCQHSPIYLGGRYNKYSRELPQTPWFVDGERRMDSSVNELIADTVQKYIACDKIVFSSSGREDVDVMMLGNGRPFVLEILNPRKVKWNMEDFKKIENEINDSTKLIFVRNLKLITKKDTLILKEGEEEKRKVYSALCILGKTLSEDDLIKLESMKDIRLNQKTPIRVLHRRTLATRERLLHSIKGEILSKNQLRIKIETQAGTYVKEFVHGDFGRTVPSLGTLLNTTADILELDVESIELEWPPEPS